MLRETNQTHGLTVLLQEQVNDQCHCEERDSEGDKPDERAICLYETALDFTIDGRNASQVASAGEQKMVVMFLKFAKLQLFREKFDEPAIFLLDDIDAELDYEILQELLTRLPPQTQVFATSAKERFLPALETGVHRRLTIENGQVTTVRDFN